MKNISGMSYAQFGTINYKINSTSSADCDSCYENCIKTCRTSSYTNACNECYQNCCVSGYN